MIKYIIDKENKYDEDILFHLRKHNYSFTDDYTKKSFNLYCVEDTKLIGALRSRIGWNWSNVSDVFYDNLEVLKSMISTLTKITKEYAEGIKIIEEVKDRFEDFLSVGFIKVNVVNVTESETWYYGDLTNLDKPIESKYEVKVAEEKNDEYDTILKQKSEAFEKENKLNKVIEEYNIVALDDGNFCGGAGIEVYDNHIYTHLLAVNTEYRGNLIGTKLMKMVEDIARENNHIYLSVGTAEFQAKPFYEKLGYKVVHTREDNPKGFKGYTLINHLD